MEEKDNSADVVYREVPVLEGYDLWSSIYDEENNPLIVLESDLVMRLLGELEGLSVADIGCGTGRHALAIADAGARVTAMDFSAGMLAKATAKPGAAKVQFLQLDVTSRGCRLVR